VKRAVAWAVTVALAGAAHALCGRFLAGRDVVVALLVESRAEIVLVIAALLLARLFLFLLAPGWALYLIATLAVERYGRRAVERRP
jgi:hypothetical protein